MWTEERVGHLTRLWAEGLTASVIAVRLGGVTRNAVIGKAHRLGLPGQLPRKAAIYPKPRLAPGRKLSRGRKPVQRHKLRFGGPASPKPTAPVFLPEPPPCAEAGRVALLDLGEDMCRWPYGDPRVAGFHFCGNPGQPYCAHHKWIAHRR